MVGPEKIAPKEGRQKSTFNLGNIGKVVKTAEETPVAPTTRTPDKPIDLELLQKAWDELKLLRVNNLMESDLLKREYTIKSSTIVVPLYNGVEEPLLAQIRASWITFLRDRLGNSSLLVEGDLQTPTSIPKRIHTNKDRFEHLAEKNPVLRELKERFGFDPELS